MKARFGGKIILKWNSKTFVQRIELELSRLDEIIYSNIDSKISSLIDLSDEK